MLVGLTRPGDGRSGRWPAPARRSQRVRGALHPLAAPVQDVGVDHGRLHIALAEEFLNGWDVVRVVVEELYSPRAAWRSPFDSNLL